MQRAYREIISGHSRCDGRFRGSRRAGFTLFELVITLAVMGILAAIAVPRYANSIGRYRAESAARRVAADLLLARASAKAASSPRSVTFDAAAGSYTVAGVRNPDHPGAPYKVDLAADPYRVKLDFADFGGAPQAQFDMYGWPLWSGKVTLHVGDFWRTVQVVKEDGSVTVQ